MTAIRASLQRQVFHPDDERLMSMINVVRSGNRKKKTPTFLCVALTLNQPITVRLYQVKSGKDDAYSKKRSWLLRDIRQVDGINPRKPIAEFELLVLDKSFKFTAASSAEKDAFIRQLYKLSDRFLPLQRPEFINVSIPVEEPTFTIVSDVSDDMEAQNGDNLADYQPISAKEEADFRRLLAHCNLTIGEADQFFDQLSSQLSALDGANIGCLLQEGNAQAITALINLIDSSLGEVDRLESQLDAFHQLLAPVRDSVEMMEEKDGLGRVELDNDRRLIDHLAQTISAVELTNDDVRLLTDVRALADPASINRCTRAAHALQRCLHAKVPVGMDRMAAYKQQMIRYEKISEDFAEKLIAHLSALFQNLMELADDTAAAQWHRLSIPKHSQRHHALMPFAELIMWLKLARPKAYNVAIDRYVESTRALYIRDLNNFFELLKGELSRIAVEERKGGSRNTSFVDSPRLSGAQKMTIDTNMTDREQYIKILETMLGEIEPVVLSEQKFCIRFFHINYELLASADTQSVGSGDSGSGQSGGSKQLEKQFNEHVRGVLRRLFANIDNQLKDFVDCCQQTNQYIVMILLARLSKKVLSVQDAGSYVSVIFGTLVINVKRHFDQLMDSQVHSLGDVRIAKRTRIGLLDTIGQFRALATEAEAAFRDSERRADVDRWYIQLVNSVCEGIEKAANSPNSKSPPAVVRFENYHQLYSDVSELKIACLDSGRKTLKKHYQDNIDSYVREYIGRPLERLQTFFDQIERCIEQGMKPEEIGYQQQFSKQELRRIVTSYPGKEVKKGLEQLYRKTEKHLIDRSPLLQVVWRNMQDEFLRQLKHYDQLMGQCYPNSKIDLDFSLQDVLQYFSEIAQTH